MKTKLEELADIYDMVKEAFAGDGKKAKLWIESKTPMFGNVSPIEMMRAGRLWRVRQFVEDARENAQISEEKRKKLSHNGS